MFEIRKCFEISAAHRLELSYASKCARLHGHNWQITVCARSPELDAGGMVIDFTEIKRLITDALDHADISDRILLNGKRVNPTAENIARFVAEKVGPKCFRVEVCESEGNTAIWRAEE